MVELESEFVEVEMTMAAVENRVGQVLAAEKIIDFGCWLGTLGAHYPGLKVVVERGTFSFRCKRLLKPNSFCRGLPSKELSMRMHAAGIHYCCFVGWSLLGSTQTDDADVLDTRVLSWLHY